jgi:hypothetical protein
VAEALMEREELAGREVLDLLGMDKEQTKPQAERD